MNPLWIHLFLHSSGTITLILSLLSLSKYYRITIVSLSYHYRITIAAGNRIYVASKMPIPISISVCDMIAEEKQLQKAATPYVNDWMRNRWMETKFQRINWFLKFHWLIWSRAAVRVECNSLSCDRVPGDRLSISWQLTNSTSDRSITSTTHY